MEIEHNREIRTSGSTAGKNSDPELKAYQELANAIIIQAAKDYRKLKKAYDSPKTQRDILEIEDFFRSEFFAAITNVDGNWLLKKLKAETASE